MRRPEGVLTPAKPKQSLTISFRRQQVNLLSTYLIVANRTNPADIKAIRVSMQVVANENFLRMENGTILPYFEVRMDGRRQDPDAVMEVCCARLS